MPQAFNGLPYLSPESDIRMNFIYNARHISTRLNNVHYMYLPSLNDHQSQAHELLSTLMSVLTCVYVWNWERAKWFLTLVNGWFDLHRKTPSEKLIYDYTFSKRRDNIFMKRNNIYIYMYIYICIYIYI